MSVLFPILFIQRHELGVAICSICFCTVTFGLFIYGTFKPRQEEFKTLNIAMILPLFCVLSSSILVLSGQAVSPAILAIFNARGIIHLIFIYPISSSGVTESSTSTKIPPNYLQDRKDQMDRIEAEKYISHFGQDETIVEMNIKEPTSSQFFFTDSSPKNVVRIDTIKSSKTLVNKFIPSTNGILLDREVVFFANPKSSLPANSANASIENI
ncbi:hypothetical protein HDV06_003417 [Boothiomyces sp. JEL0866]|nr:hypothetical protein HDV06_003369 [Boothiomyces sp. JEL0866]KAJ3325647.1 hypothetical protein HDV06_003417 [Boothiomyces sp. JEL0866]